MSGLAVLERRRRIAQDRRGNLVRRVATERMVPPDQLVQQDPERELVGPVIDLASLELLGGHVGERADGGARRGELDRRGSLRAGHLRIDELGHPEIEDLRGAARRDEDVLGLQVAVHDSAGVRRRQAAGDRRRDVQRLRPRQRAAAQTPPQRLAFEELGDKEEVAVLLADVVDGEDAGMRQRGHRPRLAGESRDGVGVEVAVRRQDLDRDVTPEPRVVGTIDLAHAAGSKERDDPVRAEGPASRDHGVGLRHSSGHAPPTATGRCPLGRCSRARSRRTPASRTRRRAAPAWRPRR